MKKLLCSLILALSIINVFADEDKVCYFFMNDGSFKAFYKEEIQKIEFSNYSVDSVYCEDVVVQEVWTADSVYRMPIADIDSVSFVRPATEYRQDVVNMSNGLWDYVLQVDGMKVRVSSSVPRGLLPKVNEVLFHEFSDRGVDDGFMGRVRAITESPSYLTIDCDSAQVTDVYKKYVFFADIAVAEVDNGNGGKSYVGKRLSRSATKRRAHGSAFDDDADEDSVKLNMNYKLGYGKKFTLKTKGSLKIKERVTCIIDEENDENVYYKSELLLDPSVTLSAEYGYAFEADTSSYITIDATTAEAFTVKNLIKEDDEEEEKVDGYTLIKIPIYIPNTILKLSFKAGVFLKVIGEIKAGVEVKWEDSYSINYGCNNKSPETDDTDVKSEKKNPLSCKVQGKLDGTLKAGLETKLSLGTVGDNIYCETSLAIGPSFKGNLDLNFIDTEAKASWYGFLKDVNIECSLSPVFSIDFVVNAGFWKHKFALLKKEIEALKGTGYLLPKYSDFSYTRGRNNSLIVKMKNERCTMFANKGVFLYDETGTVVAQQYHGYNFVGEETGKYDTYTFENLDFQNHRYKVVPKTDVFNFISITCPGEFVATCVDSNHPHLIDLGLPSGTCWSCSNLTHADTHSLNMPFESGGYFVWGTTSDYNSVTLPQDYDGFSIKGTDKDPATKIWGDGYYMPNYAHFEELRDNCSIQVDKVGETEGLFYTGKNGNHIFLPYAGYRACGEPVVDDGSWRGFYLVCDNDPDLTLQNHVAVIEADMLKTSHSTNLISCPVRPVSGTILNDTIVATPDFLDFGAVAVGETVSKTIKVYNPGIDAVGVRIVGPEDGAFSVYDDDCDRIVPPRSSIEFQVDFTPYSATSSHTGEVTFNGQAKVFVMGYGVSPDPILIDNLWFTETAATMKVNEYKTIEAQITPAAPTNSTLAWSSSDNSVAEVDEKGVVHALAPGKCSITAKTTDGSNLSATCEITVNTADNCINGHEYVDLGLPSGIKWATCNVGASKPEEYGDYFAWGETTTKSSYFEENSLTAGKSIEELQASGIIGSDGNLTPAHDAATQNWGGSWRMPTKLEIDELQENTTTEWTTSNGVTGRLVKSKRNGNSIFIPAAGYRDGTKLRSAGEFGYCWGSTPDESYAYELGFFSGFFGGVWNGSGGRCGQSVRPVSE